MTGDAADATAADPRAQAREDLARMVLLAQQGDQDAWRELFRRRLNLVYTVCLNVTQHAADAEDASQETFLQAFRKVDQCNDPMAFTGWLKAVAAREAREIAKKRGRDRTQPDTSEGGVEQMPAAADGPDRAHERLEEIELVRDALAGVPVKYRAVLSAHISSDVVGQALAEVFQVNRNTMDQWMHRARKYLETAIRALLLARRSVQDCTQLHALLPHWNGRKLSADQVAAVIRHAAGCRVCNKRHAVKTNPLSALGAIPLVAAPLQLRDRIAEQTLVSSAAPAAVGGSPATADGSPPSAATGGPADPTARVPWPHAGWKRPLAIGGAGAAIAAAVLVVTLLPSSPNPFAGPDPSQPPGGASATSGGPSADPSASGGGPPSPQPSGTASGTTSGPNLPISTAAPRWAMAYMDRATTTEAPIGTEVPLGSTTQWRTSQSATSTRPITVVHTATGAYTVRLPDMADEAGVAHTTAYRTLYRGRSCLVGGYRTTGPDELIDVHCFDQAGAPVDWWFTLFFGAPSGGSAPQATVRYDGAKATGYNSTGRLNQVLRDGPGRYRAILPGAPFAADRGFADVNAWATDAAVRCQPQGSRPAGDSLEITVGCYRIGTSNTPQPVDAPWLLTYVDGTGLQHAPTTPAAYVTTAGDPANPTVDHQHSYATSGETPTVTRTGLGQYQVTYSSLGKLGDTVQVTATGADAGYCLLVTVNSTAAPRLDVVVHCYTPAGVPGDTQFAFAYLRAP